MRRNIFKIFLTTILTNFRASGNVIDGIVGHSLPQFRNHEKCTHDHVGAFCSFDCETLLVCAGTGMSLYHMACSELNPLTPYCIGNTCTNIENPENFNCRRLFHCTSAGIFPDPNDCTIYHYCKGVNANVVSKKCPSGFVFHSLSKMCRKKSNDKMCSTIDCKKNLHKWIPYEPQKGYFAFCGTPKPTMYKCKDEVDYVFDTTLNKCVYNCVGNGYFADRFDCKSYNICEKQGSKYMVLWATCPVRYYFDKYQKQCVRGTCTSEIDDNDSLKFDFTVARGLGDLQKEMCSMNIPLVLLGPQPAVKNVLNEATNTIIPHIPNERKTLLQDLISENQKIELVVVGLPLLADGNIENNEEQR